MALNLAELWTTENIQLWMEEELHPDLVPYLCDTPIGRGVKHPLIFDFGVIPGLLNLRYLEKRRYVDELIANGEFERVVWLHERAHRLDAMIEYALELDEFGEVVPLWGQSKSAREMAEQVWTDSENINQNRAEWLSLYRDRPDGQVLGDLDSFRKLPSKVTLYRGGGEQSFLSWSTDRGVAQFFADRWKDYGGKAQSIHSMTVDKSEIFAYYTGRNESEALTFVGSKS